MPTDFSITSKFRGYRAKEDITNLGIEFLVSPSNNVLSNEGERVAVRRGFTVDGQVASVDLSISASYDWNRHLGDERHLRAYGDNLEYRYVDSNGDVTWRTLADGFSSTNFNFTEYWDTTESSDSVLFVNGTSNIFEWNGAIATFASATVNTITKQGVETWGEDGFYIASNKEVIIDGITYTYTGGESTTTLTGVTPDPTLGGHAVGAVIHQKMVTTPNSSIPGLAAALQNDLISSLLNYTYVGSFIDRQIFISKQNNYKDFTFSSPRLVGQGALLTLDGTPVGFVSQEEDMYITAGTDQWYKTVIELSADQAREAILVKRLTTTSQQAAQSQSLISKIKTSVVYISYEPTLDELGKVENVVSTQAINISDPIKNDFNNYDFTGGNLFYFQDFVYVSVPENNLIRMYNLIEGFWEAPQSLPVGRFAVIDGELYGHSAFKNETYKLFTGTSDNGVPIAATAAFGYDQLGTRANYKSFNEYYVEGYISSNTELNLTINYDYKGCSGNPGYNFLGSDQRIICNSTGDGSLGKKSLGKASLAGRGTGDDADLPPKFRLIKTFNKTDFYEYQPIFSSTGIDQRWELLAFGPNATMSSAENVTIKQ